MKKSKKSSGKFISVEDAARTPSFQDIKAINDLSSRIKDLEKRAKEVDFAFGITKFIVIGIVVVFFLAFMGFAYDAWRSHSFSYEDCRKMVDELRVQFRDQSQAALGKRIEVLEGAINQPKANAIENNGVTKK